MALVALCSRSMLVMPPSEEESNKAGAKSWGWIASSRSSFSLFELFVLFIREPTCLFAVLVDPTPSIELLLLLLWLW